MLAEPVDEELTAFVEKRVVDGGAAEVYAGDHLLCG
jgi:hypothetical protein